MIKTITLIFFIIIILLFYKKKDFILGKYLPKLLEIDKVLLFYFLFALIFATLYYFIDIYLSYTNNSVCRTISDNHPFDYVYFSLITQLTIGYGDITPKYSVVRFLTIFQGVLGTILIGGIIASIIQYSSLVKIKKIFISKYDNPEYGQELKFKFELKNNPTTIYKDVFSRIYCFNNKKEITLAKQKSEKIEKLESYVVSMLYDNMNYGVLFVKDNELFFEEITHYEDDEGVKTEDIYFQIKTLFIEFAYSIGTNIYTIKLKIDNIDDIKSLIENQREKVVIDSKSFSIIQNY